VSFPVGILKHQTSFNMELLQFTEDKINHYARMIVNNKDKADELAMGQLQFYMAFRRVLQGNGATQDLGMMDAINDVLREKALVGKDEAFYK
jgi:hypothetical protein